MYCQVNICGKLKDFVLNEPLTIRYSVCSGLHFSIEKMFFCPEVSGRRLYSGALQGPPKSSESSLVDSLEYMLSFLRQQAFNKCID